MATFQESKGSFKKFYDSSKELFEKFAKAEGNHQELKTIYSFSVVPGGRNGGQNERLIEIFYGNRPFDRVNRVQDFSQEIVILAEHGATLSYQLLDNGNVLCLMYPAGTENYSPPEDSILLGIYKSPTRLEEKVLHKHWKLFLSYMRVTCLNVEASFFDKLCVSWLRVTRELIISGKSSPIVVYAHLLLLLRYFVTIGLSGCAVALGLAFFGPPVKVILLEEHVGLVKSIDKQGATLEGIPNRLQQVQSQTSSLILEKLQSILGVQRLTLQQMQATSKEESKNGSKQ